MGALDEIGWPTLPEVCSPAVEGGGGRPIPRLPFSSSHLRLQACKLIVPDPWDHPPPSSFFLIIPLPSHIQVPKELHRPPRIP
ncbi:hypothetical protein FJTKL_10413 [Diaporthe vaccinii]|uniref:Uncharacterized protein n=1 Tax=Diaporthe vaccinii TaxID=105482 RepID=A0ABR4EK33_9PEZI